MLTSANICKRNSVAFRIISKNLLKSAEIRQNLTDFDRFQSNLRPMNGCSISGYICQILSNSVRFCPILRYYYNGTLLLSTKHNDTLEKNKKKTVCLQRGFCDIGRTLPLLLRVIVPLALDSLGDVLVNVVELRSCRSRMYIHIGRRIKVPKHSRQIRGGRQRVKQKLPRGGFIIRYHDLVVGGCCLGSIFLG
jgi:hypothetical protein